jgi:ubiquitin C-terminal hydrolase
MENAPKGIANLGNTCYLNACIQILSRIQPLSNILTNRQHIQNPSKSENQLWKQWKEIQFIMQSSAGATNNELIYPSGLITAIQTISKQKNRLFLLPGGNGQEDISEFLLFFMESLHVCIARASDIQISGHSENETDNLAISVYATLKNTYQHDYSEIIELFTGMNISCIDSLDESPPIQHSRTPEIFYILNLFIPPTKTDVTIYDCLDDFCSEEILDGENAWFNDKTNKKEGIRKYMSFWNFPPVLIICLKRTNHKGEKIDVLVNYPMELDLRKYVCGYQKTEFVYDLFGVCLHAGNADNGHYTAFVKKEDHWFFCNDNRVQLVEDEKYLLTQHAYCLFYMKKNSNV